MSAFDRLRLPLAAFVAAALGGLGIALVLQTGDDDPRGSAPAARVAAARTIELREARLPATPALRLGTSPAAPVAVGRPVPQAQAPVTPPAGTPPAQQPSRPQSAGPGLGVEEQTVVSP